MKSLNNDHVIVYGVKNKTTGKVFLIFDIIGKAKTKCEELNLLHCGSGLKIKPKYTVVEIERKISYEFKTKKKNNKN